MTDDDRLEGLRAIREYIDPDMTESYFKRHIRQPIDVILIKRDYIMNNEYRYFTYKNLVQMFLLKMKKI